MSLTGVPILRHEWATKGSLLTACWLTVREDSAARLWYMARSSKISAAVTSDWHLRALTKFDKGLIKTQGVIRFSDTESPDGITFAIVGGTRNFKRLTTRWQ
jgi:hypothetical protein